MDELLKLILCNPWFVLFSTVTVIQISPIKIDPWKCVLSFIKKGIVGDLEDELKALKKDVEQETINNKRWNILQFANSCKNGGLHTKEEWEHCISQLKEYETFCINKNIPNGVIEENGKYLRKLYEERNKLNDFL